jgi:hypothetical protein
MRRWLSSVALLAALAAPAAAQMQPRVKLLPAANELFPRLLADPRQPQLSASYYRLRGKDVSDVGLGHSWGLGRWRSGEDQSLLWQLDVEGMAYSRFHVKGGVNEFETVDFLAALPLTLRRGDVSFKGSLFHESSHLGDDHIRRTGNTGFRYSTEGARLLAALEPHRLFRVYGGGAYLLHAVPVQEKAGVQAGVEFMSDDLKWTARLPIRAFAGQDVHWRQRVGWNPDSRTVGGLKFGIKDGTRALRAQVGYFTGHSPFSQFFRDHERYCDFQLVLEL